MERCRRKRNLAKKRSMRVRRRIHGTAERPRLTVYRSSKHIYCQLIDDDAAKTMGSCSTVQLRKQGSAPSKCADRAAATIIGKEIASRAKSAGISRIVFDRGPYKYHGRVEALAAGAREGGLEF